MPSKKQRDIDFLALWEQYGDSLSWDEYARRLSAKGQASISGDALKAWVRRHRGRLWEEYGVQVGPRLVRADAEFEAWPQMPREERNRSLYRFLEYHARVRVLGIEELSESVRGRYESQLRRLKEDNQIIRYAPGYGLYRDARTPEEAADDPDYERVSETREAYEHRVQRGGGIVEE